MKTFKGAKDLQQEIGTCLAAVPPKTIQVIIGKVNYNNTSSNECSDYMGLTINWP